MPLRGGTYPLCAPMPKVSLDDFEDHWRRRNKCSKRGKTLREDKLGTCLAYACEEPLVSCRLEGGHGFPGGTNESPVNAMFCNDVVVNFPAREFIFDFFDEHPDP